MKAYSIDLRQKIIDTYTHEQISQRQLAGRFRVALSFITKLLKQYKETGEISPQPNRGGVKLKLNAEQLTILGELIEKNNDLTLEELCQLMMEKTGVKVSVSTMSRMTKRLNFTVKKKTMYAGEKGTERVQKLRTEYWETIRNIKLEDLIFIDEAGINLAMIRLYARSNKGERARGERPHKRGKRVSMIGAVSHKEILTSANISGGVDGITFEAFIHSKLVPSLWQGACVVMDNCSIHKGKEIKKAIEAAGAKLIFLPPYSPEFSPIENMWSKVKNKLKSLGARTYKDLEEAITTAFAQVTLENIHNWFTHCCYCTSSI